MPIIGDGGGVFSFIHVDDAAAATIAAFQGAPGVYHVVDDDPAPARDWLPIYAELLGAPDTRDACPSGSGACSPATTSST